MILSETIKRFVTSVSENPGLNVEELADKVFGDNSFAPTKTTLVVPELKEILPRKRKLVQDIVLKRVNFEIAADSALLLNTPGMVIKQPGEKPIMGNVNFGTIKEA